MLSWVCQSIKPNHTHSSPHISGAYCSTLFALVKFHMGRQMDSWTGQDYNATCVAPTDDQLRLGLVELYSWDQMWQKVLGAVLFVMVKRNYEYFWYVVNCIYDPYTHSSTFYIPHISHLKMEQLLEVQICKMILNIFPWPQKLSSNPISQPKIKGQPNSLSHLTLTSIQNQC